MEGREKHSFIEVPQKHTMVELRCLMIDVKKSISSFPAWIYIRTRQNPFLYKNDDTYNSTTAVIIYIDGHDKPLKDIIIK